MRKLDLIKSALSPSLYYTRNLSGYFGKLTGNDWRVWQGLCPFHADKRAGSLVINKKTGAFKCFSCGSCGGDIISFHQQRHNLSFVEAIKQLWEDLSCKK